MMKRTLAALFAFVLCFSLLSCAATKDYSYPESNYKEAYDSVNTIDPVAPNEPEYGYTDSGYSSSASKPLTDSAGAESLSEKIIRTVAIEAQTKEYDSVVERIRSTVALLGGFEEQFRSTGRSYYNNGVYSRSAYMTLRIPATRLDEFLGQVGNMVNVTSQNSSASNVTGEYYDIQSRISVLESERLAYEDMLKKSEKIEDLLKIKDRLYNVIEEIESHQTRLNYLDSQVSYSTVSITLSEVVEYTPVIQKEPTFGQRIKDAFVDSWQDFAKGTQNTAVWFVEAFPTLLVIAVLSGGAVLILLRVKKKRKARRMPEDKDDK